MVDQPALLFYSTERRLFYRIGRCGGRVSLFKHPWRGSRAWPDVPPFPFRSELGYMNSPPAQSESSFRVAIAGGGPVGLTAANLLVAAGVDVVLIERNPTTSDEAKAISMDAESLRILRGFDADGQVDAVMAPGTGVRFHGRRGKRLFQARGASPFPYGYAVKSQFSQPELERVLMRRLEREQGAEIRMSTEVTRYAQDADGVTITVGPTGGAGEETLRADYLLGCDGGRSTVRRLAGIGMTGRSFDDVWLVVDTIGDHHDDRCSVHIGTPERPHVIVPGADGRCRYEFLLRPGEGSAREHPPFELVQRLLAPYRHIVPDQVDRSVNYTFSGVVADRWRDRRVLLLGDAAHMMPPFAGQGLNSGIRDAANLCWKLALIGRGRAADTVLDTYESERRPHAEAVVKASVRQGQVVMTTSKAAAIVRDSVVALLLRTRWGRGYLVGMKYLPRPKLVEGLVLRDGAAPHPLVGSALDQPQVLRADGSMDRLDAALGPDFTLLGVEATEHDWELVTAAFADLPVCGVDVVLGDRRPRSNGPRLAIGDADGALESLLRGVAGRFVLLRPDRYVAAEFSADKADITATILSCLLGAGREPAKKGDHR
ncbi:bifunctional 3-(3-hydroxy-phenyl)propionate/3-hydroxycinnamic acid hydroxylase [Nocardia amikacinitolerans]|uniref:bifunctional 3-(3-hydroxy-phenyl)propionate/3-hydroxycinnamic acid hydroxylase n=1 Tax=Nocardia amikacinitolerans TaxID=756689 RepID=UPI001C3FB123|nr:bifunctional 3-(3-hydroxy-phenyl)propionate/3-hydroxycinnamic acid hydroxylase [Nocardia amikacinitolerans]